MLDHSPKIIKRARRLRQSSTKSEDLFWERVRGGQIDGFKIRRQVPIAGMVVDFACAAEHLVIEIDGGVHNDPSVKERDEIRESKLNSLGYRVLRFGDGAIYSDLEAVACAIERELKAPRPFGERGWGEGSRSQRIL